MQNSIRCARQTPFWQGSRTIIQYSLPKYLKNELELIRKRSQNVSEILYGIQPVLAALSINQRSLSQLFIKNELFQLTSSDLTSKNPWLGNIVQLAKQNGCPVVPVPLEFLTKVTNGRSNQGVVLECSPIPMSGLRQTATDMLHFLHCAFPRVRHSECCGSSGIVLLLDQLQDVMNLGSILRSAVFFGIPTVMVSAFGSAMPSPLISKLSAGAMETLRFYRITDVKESLKMLSAADFLIVGTAGREVGGVLEHSTFRPPLELSSVRSSMVGAVDSTLKQPPRPLVLALGSEASGLSPTVLSMCNLVIRVPGIVDSDAFSGARGAVTCLPTSLNVAAATAILLHSLQALRQQSPKNRCTDLPNLSN